MSFKSLFIKITADAAKFLGIASKIDTVAEPIVLPILGPAAAGLLALIGNAINVAENAIASVEAGITKKATATAIIAANLPLLPSIVSAFGGGVTLSPKAAAALSTAIDAAVAVNNALPGILDNLTPASAVPQPVAVAAVPVA